VPIATVGRKLIVVPLDIQWHSRASLVKAKVEE